jgi:hypothetical protein
MLQARTYAEAGRSMGAPYVGATIQTTGNLLHTGYRFQDDFMVKLFMRWSCNIDVWVARLGGLS